MTALAPTASPDFGIDIWETVLWHVKRPLPIPGAPVGRRGWHQGGLAACMRVNKMFNSLASRLLYTDPVVSDMYSFAYGLDKTSPSTDGRRSKAACLALVERVFIELPDWQVPPPDFAGAAPSLGPPQGVAREDHTSEEPESEALDITPFLSEMAWVRRIVDGCGVLEKHVGFRPSRIVFESFYDITDGYRISSRESEDEGLAACSALGTLYQRIAPTHTCCWTGQSMTHIVEDRCSYNLESNVVKHVGFEDDYDPPLGNYDIRFRSPWLDANGLKTLKANSLVIDEFIDFIETYTELLLDVEDQFPYDDDAVDEKGVLAEFYVDIQLFLPARLEPDLLDRIADEDEYYASQYPAEGPAPLDSTGLSAQTDLPDSEQEDLFWSYVAEWDAWCEKLRSLADGRLIWIRTWDRPICDACGDRRPDPKCRASTRAMDRDLILRTAAALAFV